MLTLHHLCDAEVPYGTAELFFHIDGLIMTLIARLRHDLGGEDGQSTIHCPTVPIESGLRYMSYNNFVPQCITAFLDHPHDELEDCGMATR